jgi:hypothetical protein
MKARFFSFWTALLLLFVTTGTFVNPETAHAAMKVMPVNVYIEGSILSATSDAGSGEITTVEIYLQSPWTLKKRKACSGYSCQVSLSGLPAGTYVARVYTTMTTYDHTFVLS